MYLPRTTEPFPFPCPFPVSLPLREDAGILTWPVACPAWAALVSNFNLHFQFLVSDEHCVSFQAPPGTRPGAPGQADDFAACMMLVTL